MSFEEINTVPESEFDQVEYDLEDLLEDVKNSPEKCFGGFWSFFDKKINDINLSDDEKNEICKIAESVLESRAEILEEFLSGAVIDKDGDDFSGSQIVQDLSYPLLLKLEEKISADQALHQETL